jgi:hypothetical protein
MEIAAVLAVGFSSVLFPLMGLAWLALRNEHRKNQKVVRTIQAFRRRR